jgi:TP901 family phage tail tape measure protein
MELFELFGDIVVRGNDAAIRAITSVNNAGMKAGESITKFGNSVKAVGDGLTSAGAAMTKYFTVPIAGAATAIFKFGKDFESEMAKVIGLVGISEKQVGEWSKAIMELSPKLSKPPQELAEALFFVTSAGLRGAEAMEVLEMAGKASAAGLGETATIADLLTSAINAYGSENLSAAQAGDILTAAVREGKAEAAALAGSMGAVLPLAAEMGVAFNEVAATQAAMTKTGTDANEAATQLKGILAGLIKPSKQAEETLDMMGTSSKKLRKTIKEDGLLSTLMELKDLTNKYGEEAMARVFPNIRALMGVLDLMGENLDENVKTFDKVKNSTGILEDAFESASKTLDFKWNQALSKVQVTAISFFDLLKGRLIPVLDVFIKVLDYVSKGFNKLSPEIQNFIFIFAGILAAVGPVLLVLGGVISTIGGAIAGIGTIVGAISAVISGVGIPVILALVAVFGGLVIAVGAVVGAIVHLWKTNEEFRSRVIKLWEIIKTEGIKIFEELKDFLIFIFEQIKKFWNKYGDDILKITMIVFGFIFDYLEIGFKNLTEIIKMATSILKGDWEKAWNNIKNICQTSWDFVYKYLEKGLNELLSILNDRLGKIKKFFTDIFENIKNAVSDKLTAIKTDIEIKLNEWTTAIEIWFKNIPTQIKTWLNDWGLAISEWLVEQNNENIRQFNEWFLAIQGWFETLPLSFSVWLEFWKESLSENFNKIKITIKEKLNEWWDTIKLGFKGLPVIFSMGLEKTWEKLKESFNNAKNIITQKLNEWWTIIKNWFTNLSKKPEIKNSGKEMIKKVSEGNKAQEPDFIDKLGKLIVRVGKVALLIATVSLIATGRELIKQILKGLSEMSKNIKSAGSDIVQGLIDGMTGKLKALKNKVTEIANIVEKGVKLALKIKSPSLVMKEIGENITQGLEIGMNMDNFENSLQNIKNKIPFNSVTDKVSGNTNTKQENFYLDNITINIKEIEDIQDVLRIFKRAKIEKIARGY